MLFLLPTKNTGTIALRIHGTFAYLPTIYHKNQPNGQALVGIDKPYHPWDTCRFTYT